MATKVKECRIERTAFLTTGTSTAYAVTTTGIDTAIDFEITIEPHVNCAAGPVTLNVNGSGAVTIKGSDGNDLAADDLVDNVPVKLYYDVSQSLFFLLTKQSGSVINQFFKDGSSVGLHSYGYNSTSSTIHWRYILVEATNHVFIFGIWRDTQGTYGTYALAGIIIMNKSNGEVTIQNDFFSGSGFRFDNIIGSNMVFSYDDSTGDIYYPWYTVTNQVRKFDYATTTWSTVTSLVGTSVNLVEGGSVSQGSSGNGGNITYLGKTYTIRIVNHQIVDATRNAVGLFVDVS